MKKSAVMILALSLAMVLFAGCTGSQEESEQTLRIAVSPDFAPMEFVDPNQRGQEQFVGFDILLAQYIARQLGMELEIMPMEFNACQMAVYAGTVDMSISGYTWNEKREADYNLSDRYFAGNSTDEQYLITLAENAGKYTDAESLTGARVAVQSASLQLILAQEQLPNSEIHVFYDMDTAVLQLISGDFDCIAVSTGNGEAILANHIEIARSGFSFEVDQRYQGYVILLQKGDDELTERVNKILASASEFYDQWYLEAQAVAGIEMAYDENGIVIGPAEENQPTEGG